MQHPALIALACEAVGGKRKTPNNVGAALVLLTGAADMHDDIVDKSKIKGGLPTTYAKFGADPVLIAGDILILKALTLLNSACDAFPLNVRLEIRRVVDAGFFELGTTTIIERNYVGKLDVDPAKYFLLFHGKGAVSEACAQIGGVIGQGKQSEIAALGNFGRTLGVLMALRHEFEDMRCPIELANRKKCETLPLPLFYAFRDKDAKQEILSLFRNRLTEKTSEKIVKVAMSTTEVEGLVDNMKAISKDCEERVLVSFSKNRAKFKLLLKLAVEGL